MERANAMLAAHLLARGAAVHLVAHEVDESLASHPRATVYIEKLFAGSLALGEFWLDRRGRQVARELVGRQPDARVVVNGGNCHWPDINWVHYVHHAWRGDKVPGAPLWFKTKQRLFGARWRRRERIVLQQARVVIADSELTRNHLLTHLDLSPARVRTVYYGGETRWAVPSASERLQARQWLDLGERPAIAFVGALGFDYRKGFDTLWNAWLALCADPKWDATLIVAGAGPGLSQIEHTIAHRGLSHRVRVLGHSKRIKDILAAVDLLVSPVRYEPYGLNVQEAICRGVPALVTRAAGVAERYPETLSDMLLHDPESVEELTEALTRWRGQVDAWKKRVVPFGADLRSHGWDDMANAFIAAVEDEAPSSRATSSADPAPPS